MRSIARYFLLYLLCVAANAIATPLEHPVYVEFYLRPTDANARSAKVTGSLSEFTADGFSIGGGDHHTYQWSDLTASSAFVVRSRLIDKNVARDWLELGKFGWFIGTKDQARAALTTATKLDASLKSEVAAVLESPAGAHATTPAKPGPSTAPSDDAPVAGAPGLPPAQTSSRSSKQNVVKYQKSTPEQDALAIETARRQSEDVAVKTGVRFTEFQTEHFICFNDWDPREANFLKENLEGAYAVVSQQFDIPIKENIFVGKLPVFMFNNQGDFSKFARSIDHFNASPSVAGYYASTNDGFGHMAMWKPTVDKDNSASNAMQQAQMHWAYVLTHEFTHAFIARYRSNKGIPRWLNEGLAEVIANTKFPRETARPFARMMASRSTVDFKTLFDDNKMPGGEMYPVMMTMVEMLIKRDRNAFLSYIDDLKSGTEPDAALQKAFKLDDASLVAQWKLYATGR